MVSVDIFYLSATVQKCTTNKYVKILGGWAWKSTKVKCSTQIHYMHRQSILSWAHSKCTLSWSSVSLSLPMADKLHQALKTTQS